MHRFFIPPEWIAQDAIVISGKLVHQLYHVLRLRVGDHIIVLDNSGWEYEIELRSITREHIEGAVRGKSLAQGEPRSSITLYQALLKGSKFEFVLQKCTELGIAGFIPLICERCITEWDSGKLARWQSIILEAAEQSHRGKLPLLHPVLPLSKACNSVEGYSLLAWEGEETMSLRAALQNKNVMSRNDPLSVNLFIGPEGGFSSSEVELARNYGIVPISLGQRVLRAETAGLVAATAILYECGDLGGL